MALSEAEYLQIMRGANNIAAGTGAAMGSAGVPASGGGQPATQAALVSGEEAGGTGNLSGGWDGGGEEDVAGGAAAGAAAGGPWGAIIGAALALVNANQQKKARARAEKLSDRKDAEQRHFALEQEQIAQPGRASGREVQGLSGLMQVFQNSVRR